MNPIYIDGIGVISRCACYADELCRVFDSENTTDYDKSGKISYTPIVPSSKVRRCSSYIKLAVEVSARAAQDGKIADNTDKLRIGTILSSGYGAAESNTKFADAVVKHDPAICSPAVFSNTVPNSCVGQICIVEGYKGVSTLLMGGDPLEYSSVLLNTNKADRILCGSVEAYFKELADSVLYLDTAKGCDICEGAAILAINRQKTEHTYCKITAFGSASFSAYPYVHEISEAEGIQVIHDAIEQLNGNIPDVIFTSENGTYFDDIELRALKSRFENALFIQPKKYFGETLGSGYMLSTALAAASLKNNSFSKPYRSVLVTGIDTAGNYLCCRLEVV